MKWGFVAGSLALALLAGCRAPAANGGACVMDEQCQADGVIGRCEEDTGLCVLPNADCESGWAYQASGKCAPPESSEGPETDGGPEEDTGTDTENDAEESETGEDDDLPPEMDMGVACGQEVGSCDKLDILFVIDNSGSMNEDLDSFVALANVDLLTEFVEKPCDVHVGATFLFNAVDSQPVECQLDGALASSGTGANGEPCYGEGNPPYFTTGDELGDLFCALSGENQFSSTGNERQIDILTSALSDQLNADGACNDGFLREDAANLIVIITDEDDDDDQGKPGESAGRSGSPGFPAQWVDTIEALAPAKRTGIVIVAPLGDSPCSWQPLAGFSDGTGGELAQNLLLTANIFANSQGFPDHVAAIELCQEPGPLGEQVAAEAAELMATVCEDSGL